MEVDSSSTEVNAEKYGYLFEHIRGLRTRDVRQLFAHMRKLDDANPNVLFPRHGFTAGEFSVAYVIHMPCRTSSSKADGSSA